MNIAIDIGGTRGGHAVRGIGAYTRNLIKALEDLGSKKKGFRIFPVDINKVDTSKYDLIHYTHFHPYFINIPLVFKKPSIITIHDLIYLIYPDKYPSGIKGKIRFRLQKFALRKCAGILTISETSKKDIVKYLDIPEDKICVAYAGEEQTYKKIHDSRRLELIRLKYNLPKKFVLNVGDVNYNKNLITLAKACKHIGTPLVIVGKQAADEKVDFNHPENFPFFEFLKEFGNDPMVKRLGFIEDSELPYIYNLATIYCQPSFYEGFGMSVLKAFACEVPVVVSKTQALVEVVGRAALVADPFSYEDLAAKIKSLIDSSSLSLKMAREGKKRLTEFSWEKTAVLTYNFYKRILSLKP